MHIASIEPKDMSTLQIRNLPDDVREALSLRAELGHRSLAQQAIVELRQMAEIQAGQQRREVLARIRRELEQGRSALQASPEAMIREDRER